MAGPGGFEVVDGALESRGGMGLCGTRLGLRRLRARHRLAGRAGRGQLGRVRAFPDVGDDPWVAVNEGYEIQIHDTAPEPIHQTGGVYSFAALDGRVESSGFWNHFRIECVGQVYVVV